MDWLLLQTLHCKLNYLLTPASSFNPWSWIHRLFPLNHPSSLNPNWIDHLLFILLASKCNTLSLNPMRILESPSLFPTVWHHSFILFFLGSRDRFYSYLKYFVPNYVPFPSYSIPGSSTNMGSIRMADTTVRLQLIHVLRLCCHYCHVIQDQYTNKLVWPVKCLASQNKGPAGDCLCVTHSRLLQTLPWQNVS